MFKRILYITFIALLLGALIYFYVQVNHHSEVVEKTDLIEILPTNPGIIIEIPQLKSIIKNDNLHSEMWSTMAQFNGIKSFASLWKKWDKLTDEYPDLKNWEENSVINSYHLVGKKALPFFAIKLGNKASERSWKTLLQTKRLNKEKDYNGVNIYKVDGDIAQYAYLHNGYLALSASSILLEQSIRTFQDIPVADEELAALRKTRGNGVNANIYINYKRLHMILETVTTPKSSFRQRFSNLGNWGEFDYSIDQSNLIFNGFSSYNSEDYWHIFAQQASVKMEIQNAIPSDNKGFLTFSIDDIEQFREDYEIYLKYQGNYFTSQKWKNGISEQGVNDLDLIFDDVLDNEIAFCHDDEQTSLSDESLVILKTHSASSTLESLRTMLSNYANKKEKGLSDYRSQLKIDSETSYDLYRFPFDDSFEFLYGQAFSGFKANYFCLFNNYLFFGAEISSIKKAITANLLKQTLANDANFVSFFSSFSTKNTLFYFEKTTNIIPNIEHNLGADFCSEAGFSIENTSNFYALGYQMVSSGKYIYNSLLFNYNANLKDKPLTVWSSQLEGAPVGKPQFVKNHYTHEKEICVQDELNNLYLMSNAGRLIWKKNIGEPILGEIFQVDYYKNGKLQLLFNTASKLWILDRNGNFLERYPILLPSKAATGLSLFDYDKERNYRIFIPTIDKHIYLYTKEGNVNADFAFKTTEYPLTTPIQHFRIKGKDYLLFSDKNHVYFLNRKGQERLKLKEQFSASPNNIFYQGMDKNPFVATTDINGDVIKIYFDGNVNKIKLQATDPTHYFAMANLEQRENNNFVIVNKGVINVYNSDGQILYTKQMENAMLSRPYFYKFASNITKIGLYDKSEKEIYLLNGRDGEMYKDFPMAGISPFSIGFLAASSWRFNLVVGGENNSLHNYKIK